MEKETEILYFLGKFVNKERVFSYSVESQKYLPKITVYFCLKKRNFSIKYSFSEQKAQNIFLKIRHIFKLP